jgi:hypothetical protein
MIKISFKTNALVVAGIIMGVIVFTPLAFAKACEKSTVHAATVRGTYSTSTNCSVYSDKAAKTAQMVTNNQVKFDTRQANQMAKMAKNRSNVDQKLSNTRLTADQKRAQAMAKLLAKGSTTDVQKAAITAYQVAIEKAVSERRAAVDIAISTYRIAVDQALANRTANVNQATSTYAAAVQAAYAKALSDCQVNVNSKTVKTNLNAALKAARLAFTANHQSITKLQAIISPLAKTRQQAIVGAESAFKTAVTNATAALKVAFPGKAKGHK